MHLTFAALSLQMASCCLESCKITLQGFLLTSMGRGLDALSYMLLVMPLCAFFYGALLLFCHFVIPGQHLLPVPEASDWMNMRWQLLANAFLALTLNISMAFFIKCSSAVAYVCCGILKDVCIVLCGVIFMGHACSALQTYGFIMQVLLVFTWSFLKTFPKECESSIIDGFRSVLLGRSSELCYQPEQAAEDLLTRERRQQKTSSPGALEYGAVKENNSGAVKENNSGAVTENHSGAPKTLSARHFCIPCSNV